LFSQAKALVGLAAMAVECGRAEIAPRLLGVADRLLERSGNKLFPFDLLAVARAEEGGRAILGESEFALARTAGRDVGRDEWLADVDAVVTASEATPMRRRRGAGAVGVLTDREHEVLRLIAEGKTDREIAEVLYVSRRTVNGHVASILGQLAVHSRSEAVTRARELGWLAPSTGFPP
jgi:DNA-binding CsgD family transcriptional regulator